MRKIILHGNLAKEFGREHDYDVKDPAEAVRALCANFNNFAKFVINENINGYHIVTDIGDIGEDSLWNPCGQTIDIIPVIAGAKSSFFRIILGIALIAAAIAIPVSSALAAPLFTVGGFAPSIASMAFGIGASLVLGGVSQLLAPTPKSPAERPDAPNNLPSFSFDGPVNTVAQGNSVPICYGRLRIGSVVISAGLDVDQLEIFVQPSPPSSPVIKFEVGK